MKKTSNFTNYPWGSILQNSQSEVIAKNIMVILKRTGDRWRHLTFDEYKTEREKDGNFSNGEEYYFDKVLPYCKSEDTAGLFCKDWGK